MPLKAAKASSQRKKEYNFRWRIKNFPYFEWRKAEVLCSPPFIVDFLQRTKWRLVLRLSETGTSPKISLFIERCKVEGEPGDINLQFSLCFVPVTGEPDVKKTRSYKTFTASEGWGYKSFMSVQDLFYKKGNDLMPENTLTVLCSLWLYGEKPSIKEGGSATTTVGVSQTTVVGVLEKFSELECGIRKTLLFSQAQRAAATETLSRINEKSEDVEEDQKTASESEVSDESENEDENGTDEADETVRCVNSTQKITKLSTDFKEYFQKLVIYLTPTKKLVAMRVELVPQAGLEERGFFCTIKILDSSGGASLIGHINGLDKLICNYKSWDVSLYWSREALMFENALYLPNDVLSLQFEFTLSSGSVFETVDEVHLGTSPFEALEAISEPACSSPCVLQDWWTICDKKLKTRTSIFPIHTSVLAAKSGVFRAMFASNRKKKTEEFVDVPDLDDDTVRRLLLFIYNDTVEWDGLDWDGTVKLYSAADKYQIFDLMKKCRDFIIDNISVENIWQLLILSNEHSDYHFKCGLQRFVDDLFSME